MSLREAKSAADKLGSLIDLLGRAKIVLEAGAQAEQQESDLQARVNAAKNAADKAQVALAAVDAELLAARGAVDDAKLEAEQIVADARTEADRIKATAKADAKSITDAAAEANRLAKESVEAAKREVSGLAEQAQTLRGELAGINERIEQAKADARKRFGG